MHVLKNFQLEEVGDDDDYDYELTSPSKLWSTHANTIPLQSAVQTPRLFYGSRFTNQAQSIKGGEAPLVQNLDPEDAEGRSFDDILGDYAGNVRATEDGEVVDIDSDFVHLINSDGVKSKKSLYNNFVFNQKSVSGDTRIVIKRICGDIWTGAIEDYIWEQGDLTMSYDIKTFDVAWQTVREKIQHDHEGHMLRIAYTSGRTVTVTPDHSLLQFHRDRIEPILPGSCRIGVTRSPWGSFTSNKLASDLDPMGVLVGLYLSKGDLSMNTHAGANVDLGIDVDSPERRREVDDIFVECGFKPHKGTLEGGRAVFSDVDFVRHIQKHCGEGTRHKFISNTLKSKPDNFLQGLVAGFLAGAGYREHDSNEDIHVYTAVESKTLRDDLVDILGLLGIRAVVFDRTKQHHSEDRDATYGFGVLSMDIESLPIWAAYEGTQENLENRWKPSVRTTTFETIHVVGYDGRETTKADLGLESVWQDLKKVIPSIEMEQGDGAYTITKEMAVRATGAIATVAKSDLLWDTIISIEVVAAEDEVYDLSVADSEAFAVNGGLLVHNSGQSSRVLIQKGDKIKKNQLLAASSYTDDNGTLNMGLNARVAMVPMKGQSMDDAIVVSESFAKRLRSEQFKTIKKEVEDSTNTDRDHFRSLFPTKFEKVKLDNIDRNGIVKPGTILKKGDPVILATAPRPINSSGANLGKLSKALSQSRRDASMVWEEDADAEVTDVKKTKNGWKVVTKYSKASKDGDKIVFRQGNKGTISEIMSDDQMPRDKEGNPMEVLLNPLSLYSRANAATAHELILGKAAKKLGRPLKLTAFTKKGETWDDVIDKYTKEADVEAEEMLYDPVTGRYLEAPVTTGFGYIQKLHHTASSKMNHRGSAGYDASEQPIRGGSESGKAKRMSGLETTSLLSSGAYHLLRDGGTIRGQKNDAYWRAIRSGKTTPKVGTPFVYHKFRAMLNGAGMNDRDIGDGKRRLAAFTDKDLNALNPVDVENGDTVNLKTFEEVPGGLFDKNLTVSNKWGRIRLPRPVINPAFEGAVVDLLGLKRKDLDLVLSGEKNLMDVKK